MAGSSTVWDRVAPLYDLQLWLERAALDTAIDLAAPQPADRLLDLGTGTGGLLRRVAARGVPLGEAVGVDGSAAMLARVPPLPEGWRTVRAAAGDLPFEDESFDLVAIAYLLHLLDPSDRRKVLSEAARVLAPGGRLVTVTIAPPRSPRLAAFAERAFRRRPLRSGLLRGLRPLDPTPELEAHGLEATERRRVGRGYLSLVVAATKPPRKGRRLG